jgi:hypothetical protein
MEDSNFDVYEAIRLDTFSRCECDYDLMEYRGKYAIVWDDWNDPYPVLLVYEDESEARKNFADLKAKKTDYWKLSSNVKKEYQITATSFLQDLEVFE